MSERRLPDLPIREVLPELRGVLGGVVGDVRLKAALRPGVVGGAGGAAGVGEDHPGAAGAAR
ncbi:MAG: hypothetical protein MUF66_08605 [Gammaproteobacteria bacterium]|nr:hypothetical protein [Gammaproteobacteria bacterium]